MENWGLITYRESLLLVDPHNTSTSNKQDIATVVGHEIAHQWFGNLVTMVSVEFVLKIFFNVKWFLYIQNFYTFEFLWRIAIYFSVTNSLLYNLP